MWFVYTFEEINLFEAIIFRFLLLILIQFVVPIQI